MTDIVLYITLAVQVISFGVQIAQFYVLMHKI